MRISAVFLSVIVISFCALTLDCRRAEGKSVVVSGTDSKVSSTTIAADKEGHVIIFWSSGDSLYKKSHLRFNRSVDGGRKWRRVPDDFTTIAGSDRYHDVMPDVILNSDGKLQILWSQITDKQAPEYCDSFDFGGKWNRAKTIGGGTLPRFCGLGLDVLNDGKTLWAFYNDTSGKSYECTSSDAGKTWDAVDLAKEGIMAGHPKKSFCSDVMSDGKYKYVLRKLNGTVNFLVNDGNKWISVTPFKGGEISLAANHSIARHNRRIFIVFADSGKIHFMSSPDHGVTWDIDKIIDSNSNCSSVPVIAVKDDGAIMVCWQELDNKKKSKLCYSISQDSGKTWCSSKILSMSNVNQMVPDICSAGDGFYISFVSDGKANFMRIPELSSDGSEISNKPVLLFDFEKFEGDLPRGWTFNSWNQEYVKEKFGKSQPGRDGTGNCLELKQGNPIACLTVTSDKVSVKPNCEYVFKGYYASTCDKVEISGQWLDDSDKLLGEFTFNLPDTQDGWIEFFDEVCSPCVATKVYLKISLTKKWQDGRVRVDDFSLREGMLCDYMNEFSLPSDKSDITAFPIFAWYAPGKHKNFRTLGPGWEEEFDKNKYHAEYALCGFNLGSRARFGTRSFLPKTLTDEQLVAAGEDPAVWAIHGKDEPRNAYFPTLIKLRDRIRKFAPSKPMWINLLPNYGFKSQDEYREHIRKFIKDLEPAFFTYDHYTLAGKGNRIGRDYFANLEIVRDETLKSNVDFGVILQVVSFAGNRSPSEPELRWQAYTSLAYGSKYLGWFTYLTEIDGKLKWRDAVINRDGTRTRHYAMLKRINNEILSLGPILSKLKSTGVFHTDPVPEIDNVLSKGIKLSNLIRNVDNGQWVIGEFQDAAGEIYFMLVNRDFTKSQKTKITFVSAVDAVYEIDKSNGQKQLLKEFDAQTHVLRVDIPAGDGRLYLIKMRSKGQWRI